MRAYVRLAPLLAVLLAVLCLPGQAQSGGVFVVNSTVDEVDSYLDDGICDICHRPDLDPPIPPCGICTLRAATEQANASGGGTVAFSIGTGRKTIQPRFGLYVGWWVVIDGTTQPGFAGTPIIELDGSLTGVGPGSSLYTSGNGTVRGLVINRFPDRGVWVYGQGNMIEGNYIGTDATGTVALPNGEGVLINGSQNTVEGNVISGNEMYGVAIEGGNGNSVKGNYIGTDATGEVALPNGGGVQIYDSQNTVGGSTAAERNVISGNTWVGVDIAGGGYSNDNSVKGNYIGTDATGTEALANGGEGVDIWGSGNVIGGDTAAERNIISGNGGSGVSVGVGQNANSVRGNYIGTDVTGTVALGNGADGVYIQGPGTTVGGVAAGEGNIIAFNRGSGVGVWSRLGNTVRGNSIHSNDGKGIELRWGNNELPPPVLTGTGPLTGVACPNCTVDIYSDDADEGEVYEGSVVANSTGLFTWGGTATDPWVTATATDTAGNTSEFWSLCIPHNTNGNPETRIDIAFVPDDDYQGTVDKPVLHGGHETSFLKDVEDKRGIYADLPPISSHMSDFNFYFSAVAGEADDCGDPPEPWHYYGACLLVDTAAVLHAQEFGDCTDGREFSAEGDDTQAFRHESGHGVFGLADEYEDHRLQDYTYYFQPRPLPNIWDSEQECRDAAPGLGVPASDCSPFCDPQWPACGSGWWRLDKWMNEVMRRGEAGDVFGVACTERINWVFGETEQALRPPGAYGTRYEQGGPPKTVMVRLNVSESGVSALGTEVGFGYSANHVVQHDVLTVRVRSADGALKEEYGVWDPRYALVEDGPTRLSYTPSAETTLVFPYYPDVRTVNVHDGATDELLGSINLTSGLYGFCSGIAYDDADCQTLDLDDDGVLDYQDNCPLAANPNQLDTDGDDKGNACDNCPSVPNPGQEDRNANGIGDRCDDPDADGFTDHIELYVGTDADDACPDNSGDDAWPPDINMDTWANILDVLLYKPVIMTPVPPSPARFDLNADSNINILDVLLYKPIIMTQCTNP